MSLPLKLCGEVDAHERSNAPLICLRPQGHIGGCAMHYQESLVEVLQRLQVISADSNSAGAGDTR